MQELRNLMPETDGINFFSADPDLSFILRRHLSAEDFERARAILTEMGAIASQKMDSLAEVANRQGPVLMQFDKKGQRVDEVSTRTLRQRSTQASFFTSSYCAHHR